MSGARSTVLDGRPPQDIPDFISDELDQPSGDESDLPPPSGDEHAFQIDNPHYTETDVCTLEIASDDDDNYADPANSFEEDEYVSPGDDKPTEDTEIPEDEGSHHSLEDAVDDVDDGDEISEIDTVQETSFSYTDYVCETVNAYFVQPIVRVARDIVRYTIEHPIIMTSATLGALGTATFAFWYNTGVSVEDGSYSAWQQLTPEQEFISVLNGVITQIAYMRFNAFFIHKAYNKLIEMLPLFCENWRSFTSNSLITLLSAWAGLANGAIVYAGYQSLPYGEFTAIIPAANTWSFILGSRFVSLHLVGTRIGNLFSQDARLQNQCMELIKHLKPELLPSLNQILGNTSINDENFDRVFSECMRAISDCYDPTDPVRCSETVVNLMKMVPDLVLASMALAVAFALFGDEGFTGLMLIGKVFGYDLSANTNAWQKILLGSEPGAISALFMALSAYDFVPLLTDLVKHLYYHLSDIPAALTVVLMNLYTATCGWHNIALNTLRPDNIFGLTSIADPVAHAYIIGNVLACPPVTLPSWIKELIVDPMVPANPNASTVERLLHWGDLRRFPGHRIKPETAEGLRRLSLFNRGASSSAEKPLEDMSEADLSTSRTLLLMRESA